MTRTANSIGYSLVLGRDMATSHDLVGSPDIEEVIRAKESVAEEFLSRAAGQGPMAKPRGLGVSRILRDPEWTDETTHPALCDRILHWRRQRGQGCGDLAHRQS